MITSIHGLIFYNIDTRKHVAEKEEARGKHFSGPTVNLFLMALKKVNVMAQFDDVPFPTNFSKINF